MAHGYAPMAWLRGLPCVTRKIQRSAPKEWPPSAALSSPTCDRLDDAESQETLSGVRHRQVIATGERKAPCASTEHSSRRLDSVPASATCRSPSASIMDADPGRQNVRH